MKKTVAILILWVASGILNFGGSFAFFQIEYPSLAQRNYRKDLGFSILVGITGPIGFLPIFLGSGFYEHGLKFK